MNIIDIILDELKQFDLVEINHLYNIENILKFPYTIICNSTNSFIKIHKIERIYQMRLYASMGFAVYNIQSHFNFDTIIEIICNILTNYNIENKKCLKIMFHNSDVETMYITVIDKKPKLTILCKIFTKEQFDLNAFRHIIQNSYHGTEYIYIQL